mmetsp:Transcript_9588/g.13586  ORF Transcript_9588/g.13586 Transcript_9588/m.13586 type:complete len:138 (-) Transcript_9588:884-1297(-)
MTNPMILSFFKVFLYSSSFLWLIPFANTLSTPNNFYRKQLFGVDRQKNYYAMSSTCLMSSYSKSKKLPNGSKNAGVYAESSLLDEFRTADGEIIEPYRTLKVGRGANKREIKTAYKKLAKKYHPDGARNLSILPGKW